MQRFGLITQVAGLIRQVTGLVRQLEQWPHLSMFYSTMCALPIQLVVEELRLPMYTHNLCSARILAVLFRDSS